MILLVYRAGVQAIGLERALQKKKVTNSAMLRKRPKVVSNVIASGASDCRARVSGLLSQLCHLGGFMGQGDKVRCPRCAGGQA